MLSNFLLGGSRVKQTPFILPPYTAAYPLGVQNLYIHNNNNNNNYYYYYYYYYYCEVGATERDCSGSIGSDDTRGYGAGSGDVGKELPRGMIP